MCFHRNSATYLGSHGGVISCAAAFGESCRKKNNDYCALRKSNAMARKAVSRPGTLF